jgi:hypothetical protein
LSISREARTKKDRTREMLALIEVKLELATAIGPPTGKLRRRLIELGATGA